MRTMTAPRTISTDVLRSDLSMAPIYGRHARQRLRVDRTRTDCGAALLPQDDADRLRTPARPRAATRSRAPTSAARTSEPRRTTATDARDSRTADRSGTSGADHGT